MKIRSCLSYTYSQFKYLLGSDALDDFEKADFRRILWKDESLSAAFLKDSLQQLSAYLTKYHKSRCVILVDEYDAPLESAHHNGFFKEARDFLG